MDHQPAQYLNFENNHLDHCLSHRYSHLHHIYVQTGGYLLIVRYLCRIDVTSSSERKTKPILVDIISSSEIPTIFIWKRVSQVTSVSNNTHMVYKAVCILASQNSFCTYILYKYLLRRNFNFFHFEDNPNSFFQIIAGVLILVEYWFFPYGDRLYNCFNGKISMGSRLIHVKLFVDGSVGMPSPKGENIPLKSKFLFFMYIGFCFRNELNFLIAFIQAFINPASKLRGSSTPFIL